VTYGSNTNAGTATAGASYAGDANHLPSSDSTTFVIDRAMVDVTADPKSRVYGDLNPALTATITGFVGGQTLTTSGISGSPSLSTSASTASPVGSYAIVVGTGSLAAANYQFHLVDGSLSVTKATLTVTADSKSKLLNAANPALTVQYSGFRNGEILATSGVTGVPSVTTTATTSSPVGTYPITVAVGTLTSANYAFAFAGGTLTIGYRFTGFAQPIDNLIVNKANAGQTIPVKWRLSDASGAGVSDPSSFVNVLSAANSCGAGLAVDDIETYSGASGLQYLGDGNWQFNWKTPKTYAGQCRTMTLILSDIVGPTPADRTARFQFR